MEKPQGSVRIFFSGDLVGNPGRKTMALVLSQVIEKYEIDFVVSNCENAAGGRGITTDIVHYLFKTGVDVITMGDHVWDNRSVFEIIDKSSRIIRPANLSSQAPGCGSTVYEKNGVKIGVVQVLGRTFVPMQSNCPFEAVAREVEKLRKSTNIIVVDVHAEATSEKIAIGRYLDGSVSLVAGTHTHVQTSDSKILPKGTAYITDAGMTGPADSVLGRCVDAVLKRFVTGLYTPFSIAKGDVQVNGVIADIDAKYGKAINIQRIDFNVPEDELKNCTFRLAE